MAGDIAVSQPEGIPSLFFQFNPALTYRPLTQETFFWLGQKIFGMWPAGFHGASLIAHLLGATLVYALLRNFFSPLPCLTGTFFYAVHSAHFTSGVYHYKAIRNSGASDPERWIPVDVQVIVR